MGRRGAMLVAVVSVLALVPVARADHSGPYHWPGDGVRVIKVIDSVKGKWDAVLAGAVADWNMSEVVALEVVRGSEGKKARRRCPPRKDAIRVCNHNYGYTGWAGLARFWVNDRGHIVAATAKVNTFYRFDDLNRRKVTCHELGHTLGLGHRSSDARDSCLPPYLDQGSDRPDPHDLAAVADAHAHNRTGTAMHSEISEHGDEEVTMTREGPYRVFSIKLLAGI